MTLDIPAAYQGVAICTYVSMHNVCCQSVWCVVIVCEDIDVIMSLAHMLVL